MSFFHVEMLVMCRVAREPSLLLHQPATSAGLVQGVEGSTAAAGKADKLITENQTAN